MNKGHGSPGKDIKLYHWFGFDLQTVSDLTQTPADEMLLLLQSYRETDVLSQGKALLSLQ